MESEASEIICPFCRTPMIRGYVTQLASGGTVYFTKKRLPYAFGWLGTLGKERETILDDFPDNYSKTGYKCNNCNAVLIEGKPKPTEADKAQAAQAEREKQDLKDRIRQIQRF